MLRSMSIRLPRLLLGVCCAFCVLAVELDLHQRLGDVVVGDLARASPSTSSVTAVSVGRRDPAGEAVDRRSASTLTSRSALRRQWRGSVSGRSTPREVTSRV